MCWKGCNQRWRPSKNLKISSHEVLIKNVLDGAATVEISTEATQKLEQKYHTIQQSHWTLGIYPKEMKSLPQKAVYAPPRPQQHYSP